MKKRIISLIIVIALIISSLALSITAFASSKELKLNIMASTIMNGMDDLEWFYFTPEESGEYSLLSYNDYPSHAYLYTREKQANGEIDLVKHAYSNKDENYADNGHNSRQFCLTHHLDAGVTYYYAVGWYLSDTSTSSMQVMLRNDYYDIDRIESIELGKPVALEIYNDGIWARDADNQRYYRYSVSKVLANLSVTINFTDGTSITAPYAERIGDFSVSYIDNQYDKHWYPDYDDNYNGNILTIKILDKTASVSVPIIAGTRYYTKGTAVDLSGNPIKNANVAVNRINTTVTDENGNFSLYLPSGINNIEISTDHSITRKIQLTVSLNKDNNDFTDTPFEVCNCDYVDDDVINAKDFAFIKKSVSNAEKDRALSEFANAINFTESDYK
ncbi:MAG: carboxypeptidase-like regulatory domain-containing protein [Acetobacter sp.]|nr:carboxypeptidase-like regulatory domain-containing protein [Bacteroides sp.]MCM1340404.1 carboxypeptidase-like regulatory domain-containing protein [Acetobacter sp.]MCM1432949.1 carboxypeptidase-like regulatory domain-containing protein [Clostridiales bacterium]